jgi:hypothetical protein
MQLGRDHFLVLALPLQGSRTALRKSGSARDLREVAISGDFSVLPFRDIPEPGFDVEKPAVRGSRLVNCENSENPNNGIRRAGRRANSDEPLIL